MLLRSSSFDSVRLSGSDDRGLSTHRMGGGAGDSREVGKVASGLIMMEFDGEG